MADKPNIFSDQAVRQIGESVRYYQQNYRNSPPPPRRQPVYFESPQIIDIFPAQIIGRVEILIPDDVNCPAPLGLRYYGSYSWREMMDDPDGIFFLVKPNGRFGKGGQCDAAIEDNLSNSAIEVPKMIVLMRQSVPMICESSEMESSEFEYSSETNPSSEGLENVSAPLLSTNFRYRFNLGVPRSDCTARHVLAVDPGNDIP